jgi:hypothetical protein
VGVVQVRVVSEREVADPRALGGRGLVTEDVMTDVTSG